MVTVLVKFALASGNRLRVLTLAFVPFQCHYSKRAVMITMKRSLTVDALFLTLKAWLATGDSPSQLESECAKHTSSSERPTLIS